MSSQVSQKDTAEILHVVQLDKFIPPFVDFVEEKFEDFNRHIFFIIGEEAPYPVRARPNILLASAYGRSCRWLKLAREMNRAEKIILHGLFNIRVMLVLALQPWVLKKCYWIIWGGDLYAYRSTPKWPREWIRRSVIPRLGHFVTHVRGDYELAQQWYGVNGQWHDCFMYPSNLYRDYPITPKAHDGIHILLGNSATPTNNHLDALERLRPFADESIRIYCPLSYGDAVYGEHVAQAGQQMFGDKFIPLREFMPFDKYLELLAEIDVAIFNHDRQQGMGNITMLLGLGKKLYMRSNVTSFTTLSEKGLSVGDINNIELAPLSADAARNNKLIVTNLFSPHVLSRQLRELVS